MSYLRARALNHDGWKIDRDSAIYQGDRFSLLVFKENTIERYAVYLLHLEFGELTGNYIEANNVGEAIDIAGMPLLDGCQRIKKYGMMSLALLGTSKSWFGTHNAAIERANELERVIKDLASRNIIGFG